jgi:hypothetical protein
MPFFLFIMIFLSSQHIFCSDKKIAQPYTRYGFYDLSVEEALRGHGAELKSLPLDQTPYFPTKEDLERARQKKRTETSILKGSTEKINDNK